MKNLLVLVHDDDGQESRYQVALDLTRAVGGHLTCVDVTYVPPPVGSGYYDDGAVLAVLLTQETDRERTNKHRLQDRLHHEDVPWDWIDATGDAAVALRHHIGCSDLVVVSRRLDSPSLLDMRRIAGELIVRSGKPILAVPQTCPRLALERVLLAWDGSPGAITAMQAATPILAHATATTILTVADGRAGLPAEDAAAYLSRHGIDARIEQWQASQGCTGQTLLAAVAARTPDLVVMGGFGHSRLEEALLGGVTRTMLDESPVPVLFAH